MIEEYAKGIELQISSSAIVINYEFYLTRLSPSTGYIEGVLLFIDQSKLFLFEFLRIEYNKVKREKYRYHYVSKNNDLIFRYDNAPHHPNLKTFPHHKHLPKRVTTTHSPIFKSILEEIENLILDLIA